MAFPNDGRPDVGGQRIFVQIPAYRDSELPTTLRSLYRRATRPITISDVRGHYRIGTPGCPAQGAHLLFTQSSYARPEPDAAG